MAQKPQTDTILTPELIKIIKIFGIASISLVLILSFFNDKRANNSGEDDTFRMEDSDRLYFLNVRASYYDRENRTDAGMALFRHGKRQISDSIPALDLLIILNSRKDEAYLYLEPKNFEWPIKLRASGQLRSEELILNNGNKSDQKSHVDKLKPWIEETASFELWHKEAWIPIWEIPKEKEVLKTILNDYFRLLNKANE
jgi:hypothetical protein